MKKSEKEDHLDHNEEEQVKEEKNLNFKKMLIWLFGLGIVFSIIAWIGGYITVGGPGEAGKGGRFGVVTPEDSAAVVKGDTLKAEP
ncbi:hypothetical protein [Emticicia sp. BO119]|uniref:hypothetical protein n=1 Tax=Emticicia sp. BO119 TaxID=2757768 RepID=UPI0015F0EA52|nr:hypothetical protein [Emticicia sp. BO119]MBA4850135.1 hypothetical protein [Emticicia sp. BO119]